MIIPCGHRVLVRQEVYDEIDEVFKSAKASGLELVLDKQTRYQDSVDKGVVISIGPTAWVDFKSEPWCKVGDTVVFARNSGKKIEDPEDKETPYVVLNDEDVISIIKG